MDIQGHIIDVWIGKTSKEHPIITIYDPEGKYYSLLPLVSERGVQVIDTTRELIHHREAACDYWMNELAQNEDARLLIYRKSAVPKDKERVYDYIWMCYDKNDFKKSIDTLSLEKDLNYTVSLSLSSYQLIFAYRDRETEITRYVYSNLTKSFCVYA